MTDATQVSLFSEETPDDVVAPEAKQWRETLPQLVARLRKLLANATPGPWRVDQDGYDTFVFGCGPVHDYSAPGGPRSYGEAADRAMADGELIAEAVNALPALLDAVEQRLDGANEVVDCDLCGAPRVSTCVRCGERYATTAEAVACEKAEVPLGRNEPHSWRECAEQLQREIVRLLDALCDRDRVRGGLGCEHSSPDICVSWDYPMITVDGVERQIAGWCRECGALRVFASDDLDEERWLLPRKGASRG